MTIKINYPSKKKVKIVTEDKIINIVINKPSKKVVKIIT